MAVAMFMHWPEASREQYDQVREKVDWEETPAEGGLIHVATFGDDGLRIVDVWRSAEHWERFLQDRLMPAVAAIGIEGQPQVTMAEVYNLWAPAFEPKRL
jgi:hypothetical protein